MAVVLVDAGALIALLDRSDQNHQACLDVLSGMSDRLVTVWPALTEAMHLLSGAPRGQDALFDMVEDDALEVAKLEDVDLRRMKTLMRKYRDLPMDFADAALVRVAERERIHSIVTFDRHFRVYALPARARFVVLPSG